MQKMTTVKARAVGTNEPISKTRTWTTLPLPYWNPWRNNAQLKRSWGHITVLTSSDTTINCDLQKWHSSASHLTHTSECPLICTATRVPSTAAKISKCACTNCVSRWRQCRENALRSSTLAMTDSCSIIFDSNWSTDSAWKKSTDLESLTIL
jgi:hypothetical protein